jgi:hypothetical protein
LNRPMVYASWTAIFLGQIAICDALYKAPLLMLKASPSPSLPGIPLPLVRAWSCQARSRSYPRPHPPGWRVVRARSPGIFPQVLAVEKNWCDLMGFTIWLFNIAMENPPMLLRTVVTIYFDKWAIEKPWLC